MGRLELEGLEYEQPDASQRGWTMDEEEEGEKEGQVGVNQRRGAPRLSIPRCKASERLVGWADGWMETDARTCREEVG